MFELKNYSSKKILLPEPWLLWLSRKIVKNQPYWRRPIGKKLADSNSDLLKQKGKSGSFLLGLKYSSIFAV